MQRTTQASAPLASRLVQVKDLPWTPIRFPGCHVKTLVVDKETGLATVLLKMDPGAELPDHEHVLIEQTYVIEGRLVDKEGPDKGIEAGSRRFHLAAGRQPACRLGAGGRADDRHVPDPQQVLREGRQHRRPARP